MLRVFFCVSSHDSSLIDGFNAAELDEAFRLNPEMQCTSCITHKHKVAPNKTHLYFIASSFSLCLRTLGIILSTWVGR